jgi:hypothetical protein
LAPRVGACGGTTVANGINGTRAALFAAKSQRPIKHVHRGKAKCGCTSNRAPEQFGGEVVVRFVDKIVEVPDTPWHFITGSFVMGFATIGGAMVLWWFSV